MNVPFWIYLVIAPAAALALLALVGLGCRTLLRNPRGDVAGGLVWLAARVYARLVHRLSVRGAQNVPASDAGPLVIVSTHGAGIDPVLIQAVCRFRITFMMAADMMLPVFMPLWEWVDVIPVDREGGDTRAAREAIRRLKHGEVVAIFPEGRIVRERGVIYPFLPGVGLIIRRSASPVLPVVIEGTPRTASAWGSLWRTSRSTITFLPLADYADSRLDAEQIAADLRERMQRAMAQAGGAVVSR